MLAKKKGLQMLFVEEDPAGTTDFTPILIKVRAANPDLLGAGASSRTRWPSPASESARRESEDVRGHGRRRTSQGFTRPWDETRSSCTGRPSGRGELVTLRAGGLIPIARQYPGSREFVDSYRKEFPGADLSYHSASRVRGVPGPGRSG